MVNSTLDITHRKFIHSDGVTAGYKDTVSARYHWVIVKCPALGHKKMYEDQSDVFAQLLAKGTESELMALHEYCQLQFIYWESMWHHGVATPQAISYHQAIAEKTATQAMEKVCTTKNWRRAGKDGQRIRKPKPIKSDNVFGQWLH